MKNTIMAFPDTRLIKETDQYLHVQFKTRLFKFVDNVEIVIHDSEKVIHLRSASTAGFWDLGVNRRRIKQIKKKFFVLYNE